MSPTAISSADVQLGTNPNDLEPHWMPFTSNRQFKSAPRLLVKAKDMHYTNADGKQILDGTSGLWCVNAGHSRQPIIEAVQKQVATLDYAPGFQMGHPLSFALAARLAAMLPETLDHVFFYKFWFRSGRYCSKNCSRLSPLEWAEHQKDTYRTFPRIPRCRLWRFVRGRHGPK